MQFVTRPIEKWPRPETRPRRNAPYKMSHERVLDHLQYELEKLGVKEQVVLQMDFKESEIRRDGSPYADRRPATPRVAIAFTCRHGPLTYYCDRFHQWQGNLRAIGLGLERLRLVEETGIVSRGEQYSGFKALPASIQLGDGMTLEEAGMFMARMAGATAAPAMYARSPEGKKVYDLHYRAAVKRLHPDVSPGRTADWHKLQRAAALMDTYFAGGA